MSTSAAKFIQQRAKNRQPKKNLSKGKKKNSVTPITRCGMKEIWKSNDEKPGIHSIEPDSIVFRPDSKDRDVILKNNWTICALHNPEKTPPSSAICDDIMDTILEMIKIVISHGNSLQIKCTTRQNRIREDAIEILLEKRPNTIFSTEDVSAKCERLDDHEEQLDIGTPIFSEKIILEYKIKNKNGEEKIYKIIHELRGPDAKKQFKVSLTVEVIKEDLCPNKPTYIGKANFKTIYTQPPKDWINAHPRYLLN